MSKVRIHFPKKVEWAGRVIDKGVNEFDTEKESIGFVERCVKRGCTLLGEEDLVAEETKEEEPKEEPKEEKPKKKKKKNK